MPKKTKNTKDNTIEFNLQKAMDDTPSLANPYLYEGFKSFTAELEITTQKEFDKYLKLFMGG